MALVAFLPLLVICVTGSVLVFKHELDSLLQHSEVRVEPGSRQRMGLDALEASLHRHFPEHEIVGWALFEDPGRADLVYTIRQGSDEWNYALVNQYNGEILRPPMSLTHYLSDWLLELHFTLLLGDWGTLLTGLLSVLLCLLGITGFVLYRGFWKRFLTLRWNARLIVYFSDLHKMTGIVSAPVLLIVGFTGAWWNLTHFAHEMEEHAQGAGHYRMSGRLYSDTFSLQGLLEDSGVRISGFEARYISFPWEPGRNIIFWGEVGANNPLLSQYASSVAYNAQSGEHLGSGDIREAGLGSKVLDSYRRLHFGNFAGIASKLLWSLIGLSPLLLSLTGLYLWYQRRDKRRAARLKRHRPATSGLERPAARW